MNSNTKASINDLPDPLLCNILSFLPTKEAASTSVLSRRWRYLLAFVHNLDFDDSVYMHHDKRVKNPLRELGLIGFRIYVNNKRKKLSTSFPDFVNRILDMQENFPVHNFSLKIVDTHDPVDPDCVLPWIHNVLGRGVFDLHLHVNNKDWESSLPSRIFLSETLVTLRIKIRDGPTIDVEHVCLPKLKTLHLKSVSFEDVDIGFSKLLSGCPVLEELVLKKIWSCLWDSCSVSVPTLKRLTFCCSKLKHEENPTGVSFDTPNLVYLEYTEVVATKYPKVSFDSLVEAKIDLRMIKEDIEELRFREEASVSELEENNMIGNATEFIMGLSNVQILYLSANTLEVLTFCCKAIPIFRNLTHLTIQSHPEVGWESLPGLLKNCPNLDTLVFQGLQHRGTNRCGDLCLCKSCKDDVSTCLSSIPVKVLRILKFDIEKEMEQVKYFLKTMPNLEQLIIHCEATLMDEDVVQVLHQFQMVPREGLAKCKIQVISDNLTLSSST